MTVSLRSWMQTLLKDAPVPLPWKQGFQNFIDDSCHYLLTENWSANRFNWNLASKNKYVRRLFWAAAAVWHRQCQCETAATRERRSQMSTAVWRATSRGWYLRNLRWIRGWVLVDTSTHPSKWMIDCIYDYNQPLKASSWYNLKSLEEYPSENIKYIWIDERFETKKNKKHFLPKFLCCCLMVKY